MRAGLGMAIAPRDEHSCPPPLDLDFDFGIKTLRLIRRGAGLAAEAFQACMDSGPRLNWL
jgi:hypothetical protein